MTTICIVGCGAWGRFILRDLVGLGVRVHVIGRGEKSRAAGLAGGAVDAFADAASVPGAIDGFVVATPTSTHAAVMETLLRFERPIFVEKPLTNDVDAARRLVKVAGNRIFVMDKWRYHPGIEALRDQARSGAIGRIEAIRTYRLGWGHPHPDVDAIWILMPHDLSIAYEILGTLPEVKSAFSVATGAGHWDITAVLGGDDGTPQVVAEISTLRPTRLRAVTVIGSDGAASLDDSHSDHILVGLGKAGSPHSEPLKVAISTELPLLRELKAFLQHIGGGPPPRSSAAEGLLGVERIAAIHRLAGLST
jgi:predicted dehydrogenase